MGTVTRSLALFMALVGFNPTVWADGGSAAPGPEGGPFHTVDLALPFAIEFEPGQPVATVHLPGGTLTYELVSDSFVFEGFDGSVITGTVSMEADAQTGGRTFDVAVTTDADTYRLQASTNGPEQDVGTLILRSPDHAAQQATATCDPFGHRITIGPWEEVTGEPLGSIGVPAECDAATTPPRTTEDDEAVTGAEIPGGAEDGGTPPPESAAYIYPEVPPHPVVLVAAVVIVFILWLDSLRADDPYDCTTWWQRFWNNCD